MAAFRKCTYCREWVIGKHVCPQIQEELLLLQLARAIEEPMNRVAAEIAELERMYSLNA